MRSVLDDFRLDGKVAIITGAGKGIGAATALAFADAGADVVLTARTASDLDHVADQVRAHGRRALAVPGDVNDLTLLGEIVERTVRELGGLDIVVNNAGGSQSKPMMDTTVEDLAKSFQFNVLSPFELCKLAVPHMLERGGGVIVNVGSMAGKNASRGSLAHSLTKNALGQLTRLMAAELAPKIRVNAVLPGAVETHSLKQWLRSMPAPLVEGMAARTAMRRNGEPDDIAAAILYFCSPASSWVTGKLHEVDGSAASDLFPQRQPDL